MGHELAIARDDAQQNTLTLRLYLRQEVQQIQLELHLLQNSLLSLAKTHQNTMMPKHAHWQRVQPTTLAHHLMAYFEMLVRDRQRLQETEHRTNVMPVNEDGFSDTQALDRYLMARILDFPDITSNSIDALSDRDYCIELVSNLSILMMHLSRFCEELSIWNSQEFGLIEMASSFQEKETPHQYLPHIKPPTGAEIVGGKTGRLYGSLITLLTLTKGHALGSVKDFQECQEAVFDAVDTVKKVVPLFTEVLKSLTVNEDRMKLSAEAGFVMAPRIVEHLKQKGVRPHKAMDIAGSVLLYAQQYNIALSEMKLKEFQKFCPLFDEEILAVVNLEKGGIQSLEREGSPLSLSFTKSENYLKFREYQLCTV
ncbi:MAG: argininosuccinate lyase [Cyanobacteria bacterium]|nr:argininosuccinate lyase [Cyanobacteriota bacterium]